MSDVIDYDGLFRAASAGRADEVRSFLEAGANLRYRNKKGTTAAHLASVRAVPLRAVSAADIRLAMERDLDRAPIRGCPTCEPVLSSCR